MLKSTKTEHGDTLRKQSGIEESPHSSQLIEKKEIPGTPFTLVKTEKETFVAMGRYRLTENMRDEEEALEYIQWNTYNIVIKVIAIILESELQTKEVKPNTI